MILNIKYISASYCAGCCSIFVRLFSSFVLLRRKQKLIIDPTSVLDPSKGSFCKTTFSRKMKDFIKLALIAMLVYREILPSCMTIANETYKSISSISFFNQYKAEKTQIQQCKKIMDSALDEIDFLQDFEGKRNATFKIDLHYGYEENEQVSWYVKVLNNKRIRFSFLGWNWSTNEAIDFEARSPMLLKVDAKFKIKAYEGLENKALQMFVKSFDQVFDPIFNVVICLVILYMMIYEVNVSNRGWLTLPMFQLWLILALQGWIQMMLRRNVPNRKPLTDFEVVFGWFNYKWACFYFMMICHGKS